MILIQIAMKWEPRRKIRIRGKPKVLGFAHFSVCCPQTRHSCKFNSYILKGSGLLTSPTPKRLAIAAGSSFLVQFMPKGTHFAAITHTVKQYVVLQLV